MARQLGLFPGVQMGIDLLAQGVDALVQLLQLAVGLLVNASQGLQLLDLLFDSFQLVLCLNCRFHLVLMAIQ